MNLALLVLSLMVLSEKDAVVVPANLPGTNGMAVIEWLPELSAPPIFNHFVDAAPCRLLIGTHYQDNYQTPVLRCSIGATHHCRSIPVTFDPGERYVITCWWRVVGNMREMGIELNGQLVGYTWEPAKPVVSWLGDVWVGMRAGGEPVGDPSFPGVADADGLLSVAIWTGVGG